MPRGLGLALDRLRGVLGVIWRPVGVSGVWEASWRVFPISLRLLRPACRFSCGFEASWTRFGGILEASGKRFGGILGRLHGVFSNL